MRKNMNIGTPTSRKKGERTSYLDRYKNKLEQGRKWEYKPTVTQRGGWNQEEINERRDKIIEKMAGQNDISRIRIEEDEVQSQYFKDDYLDLELMWYKKIA